ncbi:MAG: UvrD-helicase domain-containing protein, partial [Oscillospiraceae bacterium]|nr:UvrD-helicase domain-containing protein [Oscillospiraceae bacterium]
MIKYTAQQKLAIENTGGPLLVSAAAGSGKTRVLVERLLHRVFSPEAGCDIDEFLIITYTNAAASELKARILDTIYERIAADPENRRLRRQADICGRAEISTIHGFCSRIIKENAHLLDLNPNFRVVDETESDTLKSELLSDMLEEAYSSMDPGFLSLADTMGAGRDDKKLISIIIDAHEKLLSHPYPEKWVKEHMERI